VYELPGGRFREAEKGKMVAVDKSRFTHRPAQQANRQRKLVQTPDFSS